MQTLHIEHAIVDFNLWKRAFDGLAETRTRAGVVAHRISRPLDDTEYIVIDLDFMTAEEARAFLAFLNETVWAVRANSPALAGAPQTRILSLEAWH
jgi:hypothetical protein